MPGLAEHFSASSNQEDVMARLIHIEGVGVKYAQDLEAAGIRGTKAFLELGSTQQGRKFIAEKTGIDSGLILQWLNHIDLMRIKGIGSEYSDLLEAAGVDTVIELARRNTDNLFSTITTVNQAKKLVRKLPTREQVAGWIEQAGKLQRVLTY
jgi:predicted flap endonuclease-1-like 5' DNA nuclease